MKIALCTTCMGRLPHLESTLTVNVGCVNALADDLRTADVVLDFVVVAFDAPTLSWLKWLKGSLVPLVARRLRVYHEPAARHWDVARAKNLAHCAAIVRHGADVVVNVDADNYVTSRYLRAAARVFGGDGSPMADTRYYGTTMDRAASPGRVACHAADFLRVGGYDEGPGLAWWGDDMDLMRRLAAAGCYAALLPVDPFLTHSDELRLANASVAGVKVTVDEAHAGRMLWMMNDLNEQQRTHCPVANAGRRWAAATLYTMDGEAVSVAQGPAEGVSRA